jgi:hypothetical protein
LRVASGGLSVAAEGVAQRCDDAAAPSGRRRGAGVA